MKKVIALFTILIILLNILMIKTNAQEIGDINVYSQKNVEARFRYGSIEVITPYAVFDTPNGQMPAYCMDKTKHGVQANDSYVVNANVFELNDEFSIKLWKIISNGYPYVHYENLGCASCEEAFAATKQAIYCHIHGNDRTLYQGIDEAGIRVVNAINLILDNAQNDIDQVDSPKISCMEQTVSGYSKTQDNWYIDNENNYLFRKYEINSNNVFSNLSINIDNGAYTILDSNFSNNNDFSGNVFYVTLPFKYTNSLNTAKLVLSASVLANTVLYGTSYDNTRQDYILAKSPYLDVNYELDLSTSKIVSKLKIIKLSDDEEPLDGVEFEITNVKGITVKENLVTNEDGEIEVELPYGIYYIKEIKTKQGYIKTEDKIEISLGISETLSVKIINKKEPIKEKEEEEKEEEEEIEVIKDAIIEPEIVRTLPKLGY